MSLRTIKDEQFTMKSFMNILLAVLCARFLGNGLETIARKWWQKHGAHREDSHGTTDYEKHAR